jgi:AcrR family transcriptional regulator
MSTTTPPISSRIERRKQQTREQLKRAALELLNERGYAALTVQAITDRADVGYGTFYLYFQDKDQLVWAVIEQLGDHFSRTLNDAAIQIPSPRREYVSWKMTFRFALEHRDNYLNLFGSRGSAYLNRQMQDYLAALHARNIRDGVYWAARSLPVEVMAQYMAGAFWRLLMWWLEEPNGRTPDDMARLLFEMVYMQPPPEGE